MKSVLISIRPEWVGKITSGKKTIEVRKSAPKEVPFKAYIYCTKDKPYMLTFAGNGKMRVHNGMVIGEFICDKVFLLRPYAYDGGNADLGYRKLIQTFDGQSNVIKILSATCLSQNEMFDYIGVGNYGYGWHISDLKIYDKPKKLSEFYRPCSYSGICYSCNRFRPNGTSNDKPNDFCDGEITRPPRSWQYVEELENG